MLSKIKSINNKWIKPGLEFIKKKFRQLEAHPVYQLLTFSVILVFVLEILSYRSIFKGLGFIIHNPIMFIFNILIILLTLSASNLFRRKYFFMILFSTIWLALGIGNFVLLSFRTTPLTAMDFYLLDSVKSIISVYLNVFQIILIALGVIAVLTALVFLWRKTKKYPVKLKSTLIMMLITGFMIHTVSDISYKVHALSGDFGNIAEAYLDYGFTYCFTNSIFDRGIDKPEEYTEEKIDEVVKEIEKEPADGNKNTDPSVPDGTKETDAKGNNGSKEDSTEDKKPNIIMVQLESFFDVSHLINYSFSENPTPNYTKLKEEYSSGFLTVPSIGAGTANTEFEIITGMNIEHFGAGEYPYRTILQSTTCESISYNLAELGYHTHAIHNNTGTFYDRNKVFQKLGFDSFSSIEYMNNVEYNPIGWAKDNVLTEEIMKALKARESRDFIYTITVQGHGKYPDTVIDENQKIKVLTSPDKEVEDRSDLDDDFSRQNTPSKTDLAPTKLPSGEPKDDSTTPETIIDKAINITAGDEEDSKEEKSEEEIDIKESYKNELEYYVNQIAGSDQFIGALINELSNFKEPTVVVFYGDHLPSLNIENEDIDNHNNFQTEYVLWSNFPMKKIRQDLNAYQLNAYVMERLGYDNGVLTKFHQRYEGKDDYQEELKLLQYDMLYGTRKIYQGENPYIEKPIQMGVYEVAISRVEEKGDALFVEGRNFTPFSVVYIGDEAKETLYVDENTLIVPYAKISDKGISVAQTNDDKVILSQSKEWYPLK